MQQYRWSHLLIASLALLLYLSTPTLAEKSDLSTAGSNTGVHYTGTKMDKGNVRIDRDFNKQRPDARTRGWAEPDIDRPGFDYKSFWLSGGIEECQKACANDPLCKAYTYLRPEIQRKQARCFLKSSVPAPVKNPCCISGVKEGAMVRGKIQKEVRGKPTNEARIPIEPGRKVQARPSVEKGVSGQPTGEMRNRLPDISG